MTIEDRDLRQRDIVPPQRLAQHHPTVIGVGAIGRQVALQLASIGVKTLRLYDPDTVEPVNLAPQGYHEADLGRLKVQATAEQCQEINPHLEVHEVPYRFRRRDEVGDVVFVCVDSIATRQLIWESAGPHADFYCDGRMSAEVVRVLTVASGFGRSHYPTTLFQAAEAYTGSCTSKSTIFTANIAAGLMLEQFAKWLRRMPVDADLTLNLLAGELTVAAPVAT